jgi:hypothetical protein
MSEDSAVLGNATSAVNCSICSLTFNRKNNPPKTCVPCGHVVCQPCIELHWRCDNAQKVPSSVSSPSSPLPSLPPSHPFLLSHSFLCFLPSPLP